MRPDDSTADDWLAEFLGFGVGVLSLVCLSCSVIWGLVAQDRILLGPRQRILAQAVHRTTSVASIVFLVLHIGIKVAQDHTTWIAAVIPFGLLLTEDEVVTGRAFLIGLGTLAGLLMFFVGVTGVLRNRFASPAPVAARWRAMHMLAYPAWCAALVHGLYAGRAAKPVFLVLYGLSLLGVTAVLVLRACPPRIKRRVADGITALFDSDGQRDREKPARSRARAAESLPGREGRRGTARDVPRYETAGRAPAPEPANGFAAAYRAVSSSRRTPPTGPAGRTELPPDLRPTETVPRVDGPGSTSGSWPVPSPPPVGEAPPSAYDPLDDTGHTIPAYGGPAGSGYGSSDVYDTGETNTLSGTYIPNDTYNSGPTTETPSGASPSSSYDFDAPGSGEPWNTPSGGYK
ncbi:MULTISPECIES: ferric reductase-like transmembrane domain-containing protein [Streptomyces]|uniref:Cytochrome b/b6 domain-containing protein n=2 Tax=Streptomyces TaxID=1883 RepID=A0AA40SAC8_9ACTN|nr:ferric reductase-like transmembrane domain-containing protein [Streptomyces calvus]MBA8942718.1 hypothetical protein [Streptomyces calvus]MBA8978406.1 hypothetical protein [Streptomyces calvus]GGP83615.1 membrane protein [Streptomyces calvus]